MLSKGLKISFGVGIVIIVLALGLHAVLKFYNAPADVEYDLLNVFAATFASTILTFFIGALLFDYQVERTEAKRVQQLKTLLAAELNEILTDLDRANTIDVSLSDGSKQEVVITHLQPLVVEEAVRDGFFEPSHIEGALRLARNMRAYNARVSYLLSILSSGAVGDPSLDQFVTHAVQEIEKTRRAIIADARLLAERNKSERLVTWGHLYNRQRLRNLDVADLTATLEAPFGGIGQVGEQVRLEPVIYFPWNPDQKKFEGETFYSIRPLTSGWDENSAKYAETGA